MHYVKSKLWLFTLALFAIVWGVAESYAGVGVTPKYIFLNPSRKSLPLAIENPGDNDVEIWVDFRYGYVVSDDSGKSKVYYDSTDSYGLPATDWVKAYPQRFILGPHEGQTVRIAVLQPPTLKDGEYWTRILINNRSKVNARKLTSNPTGHSGMLVVQQVNIPFHYRVGTVYTGVNVQNVRVTATPTVANAMMSLSQVGNAAYWGTMTYNVTDADGKRILSDSKDIVVYKDYDIVLPLDRTKLHPGRYDFEAVFETGKRHDIKVTEQLNSKPVRVSVEFSVE